MAATTEYCTRDDLTDRLSQAGVDFVADDGQDGVTDEDEYVAAVDAAIASAGAEINAALAPFFSVPLTQDTGSLNQWLRNRAIDLAAEHMGERRGGSPPESFVVAAARSRRWLEMVAGIGVAKAMRVPGLTYPGDAFTEELRRFGRPRAANPK